MILNLICVRTSEALTTLLCIFSLIPWKWVLLISTVKLPSSLEVVDKLLVHFYAQNLSICGLNCKIPSYLLSVSGSGLTFSQSLLWLPNSAFVLNTAVEFKYASVVALLNFIYTAEWVSLIFLWTISIDHFSYP